MWAKYLNLTTFTLLLLIVFIIVLSITIIKGFDWWVQIIAIVIKNISGINLQLYDDAYTTGVRSGGTVLEQVEGITTALACANLMHSKSAVGANYVNASETCTLLGSILPLSDDKNATLIVPSTSSVDSDILKWIEAEESVATPGVLYCSDAFANSSNARAVCASIPECAAFTYEFMNQTQKPRGCLKLSSDTSYPNYITSTYTGSRKNLLKYNDTSSVLIPPPPYYRFGTSLDGATRSTAVMGVSLSQCGSLLQKTPSMSAATWDASVNGTCTLFSTFDVKTVIEDFDGLTKNVTLILNDTISKETLLSLSNTWTHQTNMDASTTMGQGKDITPRQAQLLCAQTNGCVGFVQRSNGLWYLLSDVSNAVATTGSDLYTIPRSFIG